MFILKQFGKKVPYFAGFSLHRFEKDYVDHPHPINKLVLFHLWLYRFDLHLTWYRYSFRLDLYTEKSWARTLARLDRTVRKHENIYSR